MDRTKTLRPFQCYFCNKTIKNESELDHTTVCLSVLVPCPYNCGSYVRRGDLLKHKQTCASFSLRRKKVTLSSESSETENSRGINSNSSISSLDVRSSPNLYRRLSPNSEVKFVRHDLYNTLPAEIGRCKNIQKQHHVDIEQLKALTNQLCEWKRHFDVKVNNLQTLCATINASGRETNLQWSSFQEKLMQMEKLQMDLHQMQDSFHKEQDFTRKCFSENIIQMQNFQDFFEHERGILSSLCIQGNDKVKNIMSELGNINEAINELKAKFANLVFDVRALNQIAPQAAENLEIQTKQLKSMEREFKQMKFDLECVENLCASNAANSFGKAGFLLWKITDFDAKMEEAKQSNIVLKSPIFYSHDYGYKIRVLLYLNGLKKWKDRYALISLHVLCGEYDMLLKWPCSIEGSITLRDLEDIHDPKNFTKKITAKRQSGGEENEDPQESSSSYIFIPHGTLTKPKYLKEDTVFVAVNLDQNSNLTT